MNNLTMGVMLDDCIMERGKTSTAGSRILEGFVSPITATVVTRMTQAGYAVAGRTTGPEFGAYVMGCDADGGIYRAVKAVVDSTAGTAGLAARSTGVIAAQSTGVTGVSAAFAFVNDVFGAYRRQAANNGLCCLRPTYGTVSRYGLIPTAPSMDQINIICDDLTRGFGLLSCIAGRDAGDGAMFPQEAYAYGKPDKLPTIGIPAHILNRTDAETRQTLASFAERFRTVDIEIQYFDACRHVLSILGCGELSVAVSRYDGVKYGRRAEGYANLEELYVNTRTEGLGAAVKLAAITGAAVMTDDNYARYYDKAMRVRRLVKESLAFDGYDLILLPCDIGDAYENLSLYGLAPLAGLPSVSFGRNGCGLQLIAAAHNEGALLSAWEHAGEVRA